jgi:hypothetical protein
MATIGYNDIIPIYSVTSLPLIYIFKFENLLEMLKNEREEECFCWVECQ